MGNIRPMVRVAIVYAWGLALLGAWGIYATHKTVTPPRGWSRRRRLAVLVELLFITSCLGCAAALWSGRFRGWMAASLGLSYLLMIPLPCYFGWVNRMRWVHIARNLAFVAVAILCLSVAAGLIPLSLLGLP